MFHFFRMFYFIIFFLLFILGLYFYQHPQSKHYNVAKNAVFIIFVCISGLRYNLGVDYFVYVKKFRNTSSLIEIMTQHRFIETINEGNEVGYQCFQIIIKSLTDNPQILFLISSIICTTLLFKSLTYFVDRKLLFLSLLTYFCAVYLLMEMQALRQALAAGFVYCGLAARNTSIKKSYLWIIFACLFHNSALIFLFILPFINRRINIRYQIIIFSISFLVFILHITWLSSVISHFSMFFPELAVVERAMNYLNKDGLMIQRGIYATFFLYLFVYIITIYFYRKHGYYSTSSKLVIGQNLLWIYLLVTCFTWEISFFSVRFGWYFLFGLAICLPNIVNFFKPTSRIFAFSYILIFNFLLVRPFIFPTLTQLPFSPYQDYISCEWFGEKSTGKQRAEQYMAGVGSFIEFEEL